MKLKNIIKHLRVGVDADIWYDAGLYQDKVTAKQIAKVQQAMTAAANYIVYMEEEVRRVHLPRITVEREDGSETVHTAGSTEYAMLDALVRGVREACDTKSQNHVEVAVEEYWGSRCPEVAEGCATCDAWAEYDAMQGSNYDTVIGTTLSGLSMEQAYDALTSPPEVCDTTSQDVVDGNIAITVTDVMGKLIAKLRDIEDLSAIMRQRQREGGTMPLDELERRLKWCKDECRLLVRRVT